MRIRENPKKDAMPHIDAPSRVGSASAEYECAPDPYHLSPYEVLVTKEDWAARHAAIYPLKPCAGERRAFGPR